MAILRITSVKAEFGHLSHASIYNDVNAGLLTKGVKTGRRSVGWPDYEVKAVLAARIAGKSNDEIRALVRDLHSKRQATPEQRVEHLTAALLRSVKGGDQELASHYSTALFRLAERLKVAPGSAQA